MLDYLLIMLIIAAAIQPTSSGRAAACTFAGLTVAFDLIRVPAEFYHLSAAATDGVCVLLLSRLTDSSEIGQDLQRLCLLSIVLNFAGWVCYEMYLPSAAYNSAFTTFYFLTILSLLARRIGDAHTTTTTDIPWLPFSFHSYYIKNTGH